MPAGPSGPGDSRGHVVPAYQAPRARISIFAMGRSGGEGAWPLIDSGDTTALRALASSITAAQHAVSALRDGRQPIADGWLDWISAHRAALSELTAAACGSGDAIPECTRRPHSDGTPARPLLDRIEESYRAFDAVCGALISAQPAVAHGGLGVSASPLGPGLLVSLAAQRTVFNLSTGAAMGNTLSSLAHPSTAHAMLAAERGAAAQALYRLALLQRLGTSGATTLSASLAVITRGAFLCNAVLTSRVSVEDQPGALAIGLFP